MADKKQNIRATEQTAGKGQKSAGRAGDIGVILGHTGFEEPPEKVKGWIEDYVAKNFDTENATVLTAWETDRFCNEGKPETPYIKTAYTEDGQAYIHLHVGPLCARWWLYDISETPDENGFHLANETLLAMS